MWELLTFPNKVAKMTEGPVEGIFTHSSGGGDYLVAYRRFNLRENTIPYLLMSVEIPKKQALVEARRLLRINLLFRHRLFMRHTVRPGDRQGRYSKKV